MWEYRLTWTRKPSWWDGAWEHGRGVLAANGREVESRPDTYFVLPARADVGIKLRGQGDDGAFDIKVRYQARDGWELWEKNVIYSWNDLERTRVSALLGLGPPLGGAGAATPWSGVTRGLTEVGLIGPEVEVAKQRIQAAAGSLMKRVPDFAGDEHFLAELAEFRLPGRPDPVWSICLERMDPTPSTAPLRLDDALVLGYPELLARHVAGTL